MPVVTRFEVPADRGVVRAVNEAAFAGTAEADLVDALRERADPCLSIVAERDGVVVGHLMLTPVALDGHDDARVMGLAPMAVAPPHQRTGVGTSLVRAGLEACRARGIGAIVVLGHPGYYPRFGFAPASRVGITCEYEGAEDAFMALEIVPGHLAGRGGVARYHPAFAEVA